MDNNMNLRGNVRRWPMVGEISYLYALWMFLNLYSFENPIFSQWKYTGALERRCRLLKWPIGTKYMDMTRTTWSWIHPSIALDCSCYFCCCCSNWLPRATFNVDRSRVADYVTSFKYAWLHRTTPHHSIYNYDCFFCLTMISSHFICFHYFYWVHFGILFFFLLQIHIVGNGVGQQCYWWNNKQNDLSHWFQ